MLRDVRTHDLIGHESHWALLVVSACKSRLVTLEIIAGRTQAIYRVPECHGLLAVGALEAADLLQEHHPGREVGPVTRVGDRNDNKFQDVGICHNLTGGVSL
jgi:hypothetical protein